jgi:hypothetical protein
VAGEAAAGKMSEKLAKERAINAKAYLTTEKGVDATRIETRTGPEGSNQVENFLVPTGASFDTDFPGFTKFEGPAPKKMMHKKAKRTGHMTPQ